MKQFLTILMLLLVTVSYSANRSYTLKKTLAEGESSSEYSFYQFPTKAFANDTIAYGDSVTFNVYVDYNKHVPAAAVMFMLFHDVGTADSIKVTRTTIYSQVAALGYDNLSTEETYYSTVYKSKTSAFEFSTASYYPICVADSVTSDGFAYPSFSYTRSVKYAITVIPLKSGAAVKVRDIRFKLYLQPAQFK